MGQTLQNYYRDQICCKMGQYTTTADIINAAQLHINIYWAPKLREESISIGIFLPFYFYIYSPKEGIYFILPL